MVFGDVYGVYGVSVVIRGRLCFHLLNKYLKDLECIVLTVFNIQVGCYK